MEYVHQGLLTICTITLKNGFQLEGYALKQRIYESQSTDVTLRNGNKGKVVYTSPFGKLLIVEHNGDELPPSHWHNADGTFYADCTSDLDVVQE